MKKSHRKLESTLNFKKVNYEKKNRGDADKQCIVRKL